MTLPRNPRSHFLLPDRITKTELFQDKGRGPEKVVPAQQRNTHGAHLRGNFATLKIITEVANEEQKNAGWNNGFGSLIKFTSFPGVEFALENFDLKSHGIELLSVRSVVDVSQTQNSNPVMVATVWLPHGKLDVFEDKIRAYLDDYRRNKNGVPLDNQMMLDAIQDVRAALINDIWTDDAPLPHQDKQMGFEAWLSKPIDEAKYTSQNLNKKLKPFFVDSANRIDRFRKAAAAAGVRVGSAVLNFPERDVLLVLGTLAQLQSSSHLLGHLAELRRAPETADFFMQLPGRSAWASGKFVLVHALLFRADCVGGKPRGHLQGAVRPDCRHCRDGVRGSQSGARGDLRNAGGLGPHQRAAAAPRDRAGRAGRSYAVGADCWHSRLLRAVDEPVGIPESG